ncbi:MAG: hypothetical protein ABIH17_09785 [Pseudomonadota bacterium]
MRFGKRSRKWAAAGKRLLGDRSEGDAGGVAAQERDALLEAELEEEAMPAPEEEPVMAGDPTQHLLTALGRFQRQVAKAEGGAPQDTWAEECMGQLIAGIEIALSQNWADVKEALTDTARVLDSYEEAGSAQHCVPFLQDSYEILCLMVGDLIVDNVRSGVMQKWRGRYQRAIEDLTRAGLTLVDDEEAVEDSDRVDEAEPAAEAGPDAEEMGATEASVELENPFAEVAVEEAALEEASGGETAPPGFEEAPAEAAAEPAAEAAPPATEEASPFELPPDGDAGSYDANLPSLENAIAEGPAEDDLFGEPALEGGVTEADTVTPAPEEGDFDDLLAEASRAESEAAAVVPFPEEDDLGGGLLAEEPSAEAVAEAAPEEALPEPQRAEEEMASASFTAEKEESTTEPVREDDAAAGVQTEFEEGSAEALLHTTQLAMARGDVGDAKILALKLAANMARLEAQRAEGKAKDREARLEANARDIDGANEEVERSEKGVQDAEWHIGERQAEFQQKREHTGSLREQAANIEGTIAGIDAQIRALQQKRDAESGQLAQVQAELEEALSAESRIQTELDSLAEAEEAARETLATAQRQVSDLREKRTEYEAGLTASREELEQRNRSAADIERTIEQMGGAGPKPDGGEDMLF